MEGVDQNVHLRADRIRVEPGFKVSVGPGAL
jgi:hypothetical protein